MDAAQIALLARPEVQDFLRANDDADETAWLLRGRPVAGIDAALMAQQLAGRRKAKEKLPQFYQTPGIIYPPLLNLEQTSSEATARYKAEVIAGTVGSPLVCGADLTGGWGVDAFFLSGMGEQFHYAEPDPQLTLLARHNHALLGCTQIHYHLAGLPDSLSHVPARLDFIFLDPSRRAGRHKVVRLEDCTPSVPHLFSALWQKTDCVFIKASPLLDIHRAVAQLPAVQQVYVIAVGNECKEVLFCCRQSFQGPPAITAVSLETHAAPFSFLPEQEAAAVSLFSEPLAYVYEPSAAVLKAGAFKLVGQRFGLHKLHVNTHFYTGPEKVPGFPGRIFQVIGPATAALPEGRAHVVVRNFPSSAEALKKQMNLKDGGDHYVLAFTGPKGKHVVVTKRVQ